MCTHTGLTGGGFFFLAKSGRPSESPSRGAGDVPVASRHWLGITSTAGTGAVELQLRAHLSCDLSGQGPVEKPPGLHLAQIAVQGQRLALAPRSSSLCPLAPVAWPRPKVLLACLSPPSFSARLQPTRHGRIGWHDANQLRRLDARGDRARPVGGLPTATAPRTKPQLRRTSLDGLSSPVPSVTRNLPMQVGEQRGEIPYWPASNITLGCRSLSHSDFLVPAFHFLNSKDTQYHMTIS